MTTITSAPSSSEPIVITSRDWWLKDPLDSSLNMVVSIEQDSLEEEIDRDIAFYKPIGRKYPLAVEGQMRASRFQVIIGTLGLSEEATLRALWEAQRTLLLQSPLDDGRQWYVRIDSPVKRRLMNSNDPWHKVSLDLREVEAP